MIRYTTFYVALITVLFTSVTRADLVTVPTGLNPGDQYRFAFITSVKRDATSTNIADYNSFIQSTADAVAGLSSLNATWNVIGSTSSVDARDNTGTNPSSTGVPIFLLNGTMIATNNADLWDGPLEVRLNRTELNQEVTSASYKLAWTGSNPDGTAYASHSLGDSSARIGGNSLEWMSRNTLVATRSFTMYGMSSVLTAPGVSAVPEPSSFLFMGLVSAVALGRKGRKRQRSATEIA